MNSTQWTALKKQPDKAKKTLSALHMSPAYLKISWSELDEGDQKKVSKWVSKNASGWFEVGEPTNTPRGIKNVAPKHRKAAAKKESEKVLRRPMRKEEPVRTEKKEPWQMIKQEWLDENLVESGQVSRKKQIGNLTLKQWKLNEHRNYVEQAIIDGKPIPERVLKEYPELTIKKEKIPTTATQPEDKGEIRAYKNYGLVWTGDTSREDVTSIDYYRVEKNPPKDVSYQGSKSFHGDAAALYHSKSNKETYVLPRDSKEYLIHLRNEKIERKQEKPARTETKDEPIPAPLELDSASDRAKKSGIDLEGLYVDDTDGIRFRMVVGAFKDKTAFRCPECYRGLVFNSDSKLACGEHGSLTYQDKIIDLRKIGIDDKTTEWARGEYESWLSEAKVQGFKTVSEYVDSMKGKDAHGYGKYAELGRGFEETFITGSKEINQQITNKLFKRIIKRLDEAEKEFDSTGKIDEWQAAWNSEYSKMYNVLPESEQKQIDSRMYGLSNYIHEEKLKKEKESEPVKEEPKKSATMIYLEGAYQKRLESLDTSPIPLSNPGAEEITEAIEFAKGVMVGIIMHFDKVDIQMRFWRDSAGSAPSALEITVFDEDQTQMYHNKEYNLNLTAAEVFRIRDAETNSLMERRKEEKEEIRKKDEAREQAERKKKQFRFNKTTYSLYLKTYPYAMAYFLNDIVHIPLNADPQNLTDKELDMINEVVAEGYDIISDTGVYTVEWFKGMDEVERADEARYEAEQEKEKQEKKETKSKPKLKPNSQYFKTKEVNGKLKKEYVKEAHPFEFGGVTLFAHKEGAGWHVTEQTTGLMFTSGTSQNEAESAAKDMISSRGEENVLAMINQAKQVMESHGGIV